jgi:Holliday junction resolvase-like predicted endonuclease
MSQSLSDNIGVRHGQWGEDVAVEALRLKGYVILDRNSRPCPRDKRLEIDIVAYDKSADAVVFVEVKQHAAHSPYERRLRSIDRAKIKNLRRACNAWRRGNRWLGAYRFDVIEVFGEPGRVRPEIDHIERVALFERDGRFVRWG